MRKRSQKHLGSPIQSGLIGLVIFASGVGSVVSTSCAAWWFGRLAGELPTDGEVLLQRLPAGLAVVCLGSLFLTLPLFLLMARNATFRVFGPLHRFRAFLADVSEGTPTEPCKLREKDELKDLCELINRATEPARLQNAERERDRAA